MLQFSAQAIAPTAQWLLFRFAPGKVGTRCLLFVTCALCAACDPVTLSRITNDAATTIEIELTLDRNQWHHGFELDEYELWLDERTEEWIEEQLQEYAARDEGVELVAVDAARLAGTYHMDPSAILIVNDSMGTGPYHNLSLLMVTKADETRTFSGADEIRELFQRVEGNVWEFRITDDI